MADIELVIKIPEEVKLAFDCAESNDLKGCYYDHGGIIGNAIKNGTSLPAHDRLVDATVAANNIEAARYELSGEYQEGLHEAWKIINSEDAVPTIIPATENEFFNFDAPIIKKQTATEEKSCENCANWNEHYGTVDCMDCQNRELWKPKQTTMKEGDAK